MKKKWKIIIPVVIIGCAAVVLSKQNKDFVTAFSKVQLADVTDSFTEDGIVKKGDSVSVIAKVTGDVTCVYADKNMFVNQGDIIAKISPRDITYNLSQHDSSIEAYQAQIEDIKDSEFYDKKDIRYQIDELLANKEKLEKSKQQSDIGKVVTQTPDEYIDSLRINLKSLQSNYDLEFKLYESQKTLYDAGAISKEELDKQENAYQNAKTALNNVQTQYNSALSKLDRLKQSGINETNIRDKFFEGMDSDVDAAIKVCDTQIASLNQKLDNDYSTNSINRLNALIESEKISKQQLNDQIKDCIVTAAVSGYITDIPIKNTSFVSAGTMAAQIKAENTFTVNAKVLTDYVPYLAVGDTVKLKQKLKNDDIEYSGTIAQIYNYAEESTSSLGLSEHRVEVVIQIDESAQLKDGYELECEFYIYNQKQVITVPASSVFSVEDEDFAFAVSSNKAKKTKVTVAYKTNTQAVIQEGLAVGDLVISNANTEGLSDGLKVKEAKK